MAAYAGRHRGDEPREHVVYLDREQPRRAEGKKTARSAAGVPRQVAAAVTGRSGSYSGTGMLTAELLAGFVIIAIRIVANYEVQEGGAVKGTVLHPRGEYGPLTVFAGLIMAFFVLSFLAASGGLKAKMAVILGGAIVLTLGVKSYDEIKTVGTTLGHIGQIVVPDPSGQQESVLGTSGTGSTGTTAPGTSGSGWISVPGSNGSLVYQRNGTCPAGWAALGAQCLAPITGPPQF